VQMLVSEWALKDSEMLKDLASAVDIRVIRVPKFSGGEIPFARVAHAKYMVVDGQSVWVGSSNWEGDYFLKSRNVGVVISGGGTLPKRLATFFAENWTSSYAAPLMNLVPASNVGP
jgi:phosphatidylserine/phosphatidylglycerophosphate/cardiolipin synthase-like enzyme